MVLILSGTMVYESPSVRFRPDIICYNMIRRVLLLEALVLSPGFGYYTRGCPSLSPRRSMCVIQPSSYCTSDPHVSGLPWIWRWPFHVSFRPLPNSISAIAIALCSLPFRSIRNGAASFVPMRDLLVSLSHMCFETLILYPFCVLQHLGVWLNSEDIRSRMTHTIKRNISFLICDVQYHNYFGCPGQNSTHQWAERCTAEHDMKKLNLDECSYGLWDVDSRLMVPCVHQVHCKCITAPLWTSSTFDHALPALRHCH